MSTVDLAPTIASLAGVDLRKPVDGRDLAADMRTDASRSADRSTPRRNIRPRSAGASWRRCAPASTKLIAAPAPELYDLAAIPARRSTYLTTQRRAYRDLSARLEQLRATAVAACRPRVDAETRAKLASLGYVAPAATSASAKRDPKTVAPLFRAFEEAHGADQRRPRARCRCASLEQLVRDDPANHVFRGTLARALRQSGDVRAPSRSYRRGGRAGAERCGRLVQPRGGAPGKRQRARRRDRAGRGGQARSGNRPEMHNVRGIALAEAGNLAEAEKEFRATIAADPATRVRTTTSATSFRAMNRHDEAAEAYRKAIELAPRYADPLNGLGALLVAGRSGARGAAVFRRRAMHIAPDFYEAQLNRAIALQTAGDRMRRRPRSCGGFSARLPSAAALRCGRRSCVHKSFLATIATAVPTLIALRYISAQRFKTLSFKQEVDRCALVPCSSSVS